MSALSIRKVYVMSPFDGKRIWIIGCSFGIGRALAEQLAREGARLVLSARNKDKLAELAGILPGGPHLPVAVDVTQEPSVTSAWGDIVKAWGGIDILIYNAGVYDPMSATRFDLGRVEEMVDVNFRGALRALDAVLPGFLTRREGHVVLVGSVAAYRGLPNAIGYGASKAALMHLAENLRLDLRQAGIKVQVVSPGFVKTRLTEKNSFPMPFILTPEEAANRIVRGMKRNGFDIHFPKRLSVALKFLRCLPYALYFRLLKNM
jgi:short-subunit dehydrogenase